MPLKLDNREYRQLQILQPTQQNKRIESNYYIEGYATTFDKPYELGECDGIKYYEMIERNALTGCDISDVIFQFNHTGSVFARQSNKTLIIQPDDHGLFICADLSKSQAAKDIYEEISNGLVTRMSFAFAVTEDEYDRENHTRIIKKLRKIYDVSAVSIPANQDTEISARSYLDGVFEIEKQEMLMRKKQILKLKILTD